MGHKKLLILFTSYYFGDKTDKLLTQKEVPHQLMATPPELDNRCGLAIEINPSLVGQVKEIMREGLISGSGFFWYEKGKQALPYKDCKE